MGTICHKATGWILDDLYLRRGLQGEIPKLSGTGESPGSPGLALAAVLPKVKISPSLPPSFSAQEKNTLLAETALLFQTVSLNPPLKRSSQSCVVGFFQCS